MKRSELIVVAFAASFGVFMILGAVGFKEWCVPVTNACGPHFDQCTCQLRPPAWFWVVSEAAFVSSLGSGAAWLLLSIYEGLRPAKTA